MDSTKTKKIKQAGRSDDKWSIETVAHHSSSGSRDKRSAIKQRQQPSIKERLAQVQKFSEHSAQVQKIDHSLVDQHTSSSKSKRPGYIKKTTIKTEFWEFS